MNDLKKIKGVAVLAAKKAGKELIKRYKSFNRNTVKLKAHHEILTQADLASEKIILSEIRKNFPDHRILSEEDGMSGTNGNYLWIIDPLDGSTNFSMHNPLWCVSIGVAYKNEVVIGVIYAPILNEIFIAEKGKGAFLNGKKIKVSGHTEKALHTFCHGRSQKEIKRALRYYRHQKLRELDCRQMGSAALELAYVASGRTESILIPGTNPWDVAAGVLLVREAGGKVTNFKGKRWDIKEKDILASNGRVHQMILKVAKKI